MKLWLDMFADEESVQMLNLAQSTAIPQQEVKFREVFKNDWVERDDPGQGLAWQHLKEKIDGVYGNQVSLVLNNEPSMEIGYDENGVAKTFTLKAHIDVHIMQNRDLANRTPDFNDKWMA